MSAGRRYRLGREAGGGPTRRTTGPRFSHGYQFPRTDAAPLERGEPIRVAVVGGKGRVEIIPLRGGRRRMFDVCSTYNHGGGSGVTTCLAYDELEALAEFRRQVALLRA